MKSFLKKKSIVIVSLFSVGSPSMLSYASPWVEAQDPILRSNIQLLSDSGLLSSATSSYPFRWVQISDDLLAIDRSLLTLEESLAYRYVKHSYDAARTNGNRNQFTSFISSENKSSSGFGDDFRGQWNVSALKEITDKQFSMRISVGYHKNQQDKKEYNFANSYFALGSNNWQFSVSNVERWWGHGWANSLSLSQKEAPLETVGIAYLSDGAVLPDNLWIESFIGRIDTSKYNASFDFDDDYIWSSRVSGKVSIVEFGVSYQLLNQSREYQTTIDAKVALPEIKEVYSGFYGSISLDNQTDIGRTLIGWDAQTLFKGQLFRFYIEQLSNNEDAFATGQGDTRFYHQEENLTLGAHMFFSNDHQLSLQIQEFAELVDSGIESTQQATYALPVFSGRATLGISHNVEAEKKDLIGWMNWDYRF